MCSQNEVWGEVGMVVLGEDSLERNKLWEDSGQGWPGM